MSNATPTKPVRNRARKRNTELAASDFCGLCKIGLLLAQISPNLAASLREIRPEQARLAEHVGQDQARLGEIRQD